MHACTNVVGYLLIQHDCLAVEEYDIIVANGQHIHQIHFEGNDITTFTSNLFETVSGIDFLYK